MVFSAKMKDSKILKGMIDAVASIIDETYFVADENGLNLSAMDESHICLMSMSLPKDLFAGGYVCAESHKMGINLEDMTKIMKRAGASDAIEFKHIPEGEKFGVIMKGMGTRSFNIRIMDIDEEKIPPTAELDVQFDTKATFDVNVLKEAVADAEIYQDTLTIMLTKEGLKFTAEGEVGDIEYLLSPDHLDTCDIITERKDENEKVTACPVAYGVFSLGFLKNILKMSAIADKITIQLSENCPLRVEFEIAVPELSAKGKVVYFLAPRVSEEESYEGD